MTSYKAYYECYRKCKRIPELEDIISTSPQYSYYYALNIIRGPWEEGKDIISKHPYWSYKYARNIIKGPFEKCHHIIFNSEYKENYIHFLKRKKYDMTKINEWLI
jgi:hypothetical protein